MIRELLEKILHHVRGTWRFRWAAFALVWCVAVAGWAFVYLMPNVYEAQTEVYVDTNSILRPLLSGLTVQNNLQDHVRMMRLALLSRPNLEEVARKTDLILNARDPDQLSGVVESLRHKISISNGRNGNLYTISYKDDDRPQAKAVVQSLLNIFMERSLNSNQSDNKNAQSFIKSQLDQYKSKLDDAEQALANFKKAHVGEMPSQGQDYFDRLQSAMQKVQDTQTQLKVAEQRRDALQQAAQGEQPSFAFTPPAPVRSSSSGEQSSSGSEAPSPLQNKIKALQDQLDTMLLQYTDQYPGVVDLKKRIAMLKKQEKSEPHRRRSRPAPSNNNSANTADNAAIDQPELNPVYQDTLMSLNAAKADVAALKGQLQQQQQDVAQLRSKVNVIPEVEAKLNRLTRNYSVMRDRYNKLLQRYEEAQLASSANTQDNQVKFSIINPPFVSPKPVAPNRSRLLVVVLLFATAVGGGFAFFLHQVRPVFLDAEHLRQVTGLPVLGTVSRVWTRKARGHVMSLLGFAGGMSMLLALFAVALFFADSGSQALRHMVKSFT